MKHTKKRTERQRKKWALIGLALFLVATVLICWQVGLPMVRLASDPENFRQWLEERKLGGLLIYGAMVFFQVLFAVIPGEPLEIAGGSFVMDGGYKKLDHDEIVEILAASMR